MPHVSVSTFPVLSPRRGSALVLTILTVSLLMVVSLALAAFIRMEFRSLILHQELSLARKHARLGVELALAQLQLTAGPDQRSTATAEMGTLGDADPNTPDNGVPAASGPGTRHWTGVWGNAANPANDRDPSDPGLASHHPEVPVLLNWLVSGNDAAQVGVSLDVATLGRITAFPGAPAAAVFSAAWPWASPAPLASPALPFTPNLAVTQAGGVALSAATAADTPLFVGGRPAVLLVGTNSVGKSAGVETRLVAAPKVDLQAPGATAKLGAYAWWVGDEGVKTRLDFFDADPPPATDPERIRALQVPKRPAVELSFPAWQRDWAGMERMVGERHLPFAPGMGAEAPRAAFHRFTTESLGLLANAARGGLRIDLSAGLLDDPPPPELADGKELFNLPLASAPTTLTIEPISELTRVQWSGEAPDPGTLPTWGMLRGFVRLQDQIDGSLPMVAPQVPTDTAPGLFPIATRAHLHFHAAVVDGNAFALYLPTVVFWNPYNVRLAPADYWFNIELNLFNNGVSPYNDVYGRYLPAFMFVHGPLGSGGNANANWGDPTYRTTQLRAGRAASRILQGSNRMASAPDQGFRFLVRVTQPLEPGEARVFSPLGQEALSSDPAQRILSDGFGENTYFYEPLALSDPIGTNVLYRTCMAFPPAQFNRPLRYSYGLGDDFSPASQVRKADGIVGPGYFNPGRLNDLRVNPAIPYDAATNPILPVCGHFPQNDPNASAVGYTLSPLTSLDPNQAGGVFPPNLSPVGMDFKMQMALPGRTGDPQDDYSVVYMKWMGQHNPLEPSLGASLFDDQTSKGHNTNPFFPMNMVGNGNTRKKRLFDVSPDFGTGDATFVGGSHYLTLPSGPGRLSVLDLPRGDSGILSLGALQHARVHPRRGQLTTERSYTPAAMPAFPIGNALPDPRVHPADVDGFPNNLRMLTGGGGNFNSPRSDAITRRLHFDLSYLMNKAIWDRVYFSSVPRSGPLAFPLPNPRMVAQGPLDAAAASDLLDPMRAAERLWIKGAFNVNSTSVEAWTALLAAFRDLEMAGAQGSPTLPSGAHPFPRQFRPLGDPLDNAGGLDLTYEANRFRTLSDDEIRRLAASVVEEIRARGPVLSLAQFVNRRPQALAPASPAAATAVGRTFGNPNSANALERRVGDQALLGTLQGAMDRVVAGSVTTPSSATGINDRLRTYLNTGDGSSHGNNTALINQPGLHRMAALGFRDSYVTATPSTVRDDAPLALRSSAVGMPGYLTQADILQSIGPVLASRSDTFRVRAYGETTDAAGAPVARAWAEVLVQRVPDYVDESDDPATHPIDAVAANRFFGRQFRVLSFAWLNPDDV
jgi:hypothetical protein